MASYVELSGNGHDEASQNCRRIRVVCCSFLSVGFVIGSCMLLSEEFPPSSSHDALSGWVRKPFVDKANVIGLANIIKGRVSQAAQLQPRFLPSWPHHSFFPGLRQARLHDEYKPQQINAGQLRQYGYWPSGALALETHEGIENKVEGQVEVMHSEEDFDQRLQTASKPIMVEFTTSWCGPCKLFAPVYEQIAADYSGKVQFLKVDARENESTSRLAKRFAVKSIPSFYLIRDGEVVEKQSGVKAEPQLRGNLEAHLLQ